MKIMKDIPSCMKSHNIFIKYIDKEVFAKQLRYGGLFMRTPRYYRMQGMKNMSMGDPQELDELYPIWCVSIFQRRADFKGEWKIDIESNQFETEIIMTKEASADIIKALNGFTERDGTSFASLGNYAVVIFDAAQYVGNLVEGFTDADFNFADRSVSAIPIECGKVSYGKEMNNHPKLYKVDKRFEYQREYRIRLGLNVSPNKYDVEFNLKDNKIFSNKYYKIKVFDKKTIIDDFKQNGCITFRNRYDITQILNNRL